MHRRLVVALGLACTAAACGDSSAPDASPTGVAYSFALIGCNRVDAADTTGNQSTANIEQLTRTFAEIAALPQKPSFLFFMGDLTLGYTADTTVLAKELQGWKALYEASALAHSSIELVAIPGNHETQGPTKIAYAAAERTWLREMAQYIKRGGNGPQAGGADALTTDQSKLTYSFDYKGTHFVTLNTDPVGADWHVPAHWIASDLSAARTAGTKHIFVFGHKPAFPYPTVPTDGLSRDTASRNIFWNAMNTNRAEAMFSAHNHVYFRTQPTLGGAWQVIAGNGGSKLEATIDPTIPTSGSYYGFTVVTVLKDGRVIVKSYGRDIPTGGYTQSSAGTPTTVRDSADLTWAN